MLVSPPASLSAPAMVALGGFHGVLLIVTVLAFLALYETAEDRSARTTLGMIMIFQQLRHLACTPAFQAVQPTVTNGVVIPLAQLWVSVIGVRRNMGVKMFEKGG